MSKLVHWLIAFTIPSLIVLVSYFILYNSTMKPKESVCVYVSPATCMVENKYEGTLKNIDLKRYNIDSSDYVVGKQVVYKVKTVERQRIEIMSIICILCFFLIFFIRYPFLLYIFAAGI